MLTLRQPEAQRRHSCKLKWKVPTAWGCNLDERCARLRLPVRTLMEADRRLIRRGIPLLFNLKVKA